MSDAKLFALLDNPIIHRVKARINMDKSESLVVFEAGKPRYHFVVSIKGNIPYVTFGVGNSLTICKVYPVTVITSVLRCVDLTEAVFVTALAKVKVIAVAVVLKVFFSFHW
jgi:hypothetical protein